MIVGKWNLDLHLEFYFMIVESFKLLHSFSLGFFLRRKLLKYLIFMHAHKRYNQKSVPHEYRVLTATEIFAAAV